MTDTQDATMQKAAAFHEKAVEFAKAQIDLDDARENRQDPDGVFPAAQKMRHVEAELQQAVSELVAAHVSALRT